MDAPATDGPWRLSDYKAQLAVRGGGDQEIVATIPSPFFDNYGIADDAERLANARLIAAARRLFEAAETYAENYLLDENDDEELCIDSEHHLAVRELFASLAQARGG